MGPSLPRPSRCTPFVGGWGGGEGRGCRSQRVPRRAVWFVRCRRSGHGFGSLFLRGMSQCCMFDTDKCIKGAGNLRLILGTQTSFWPLTPPPGPGVGEVSPSAIAWSACWGHTPAVAHRPAAWRGSWGGLGLLLGVPPRRRGTPHTGGVLGDLVLLRGGGGGLCSRLCTGSAAACCTAKAYPLDLTVPLPLTASPKN